MEYRSIFHIFSWNVPLPSISKEINLKEKNPYEIRRIKYRLVWLRCYLRIFYFGSQSGLFIYIFYCEAFNNFNISTQTLFFFSCISKRIMLNIFLNKISFLYSIQKPGKFPHKIGNAGFQENVDSNFLLTYKILIEHKSSILSNFMKFITNFQVMLL